MEKIQINLDILLPELPGEKDPCTERIIASLEGRKGIGKVHVISEDNRGKARLCLHYDPDVISIKQVENQARKAGAGITEQYGHYLIEVSGVRHPRHARIIESILKDLKGVISASVAATGFVQVEFDKFLTGREIIGTALEKEGLRLKKTEDFPESGITVPEQTQTHDRTHKDHHHHGGIFGEKTELIFSVLCGIFLLTGFIFSFIAGTLPWISTGFYLGAYLFGGFYTSKEAIEGISKGNFEIDFLMIVAAVGAAFLGHWAEGALLLFLFSLGHSLEHFAMEKARKSIAALAGLAPKTALLKRGNDIEEVSIDNLKIGDVILVKPNSKIAADGIVISGNSSVNQAPITGESVPADKFPLPENKANPFKAEKLDEKFRVFSGTINGSGALEVKVSRLAADSTIARLIKLVNEAQTQKSPTQHFTNRIEKYYVPAVLIMVALLLFAFLIIDEPFSKSFYRAMAVLVAASPCALAISTPSAILSGVARAARGGVLIKGGRPLEELGTLHAIAFDKTGTLTEGKPQLTGVYPFNGTDEETLLSAVIAVEKLSDHPLAAAMVSGGMEMLQKEVPAARNVRSVTARGIRAEYQNTEVFIGNKKLFTEKGDQIPEEAEQQIRMLEDQGNTTMLVQQDGIFTGLISLMDVARKDAAETIEKLRQLGVRKMVMLTGDNQKVADAIAKEINISDARGGLLPEEKVKVIEELKRNNKRVAMVGDGVNDAPGMARSTVGIAMGAAGSDVALETADIALMADKLSNLPFAIGLSRQAHRIIRQNLFISIGMVLVLVPLTITGLASIGPAVIGHEGSTLVVVFNALRLLAYKKPLS